MTQITINSANIDMMNNTITGDTYDIPAGSLSWAELTDADMCLNREIFPDIFAEDLISYCRIRVEHIAGVYTNQSNMPLGAMMLSNFPNLSTWAFTTAQVWLPEMPSLIVDKVMLYTAGGFKIRVKSYDLIY